MLGGHMRVAERYILYRAERAMLAPWRRRRRCRREELRRADRRSRRSASSARLRRADELERELSRALRPGRGRPRPLVVLNAKSLAERDSEYMRFAGRILLTYVYEETLGWDIVRDGARRAGRRPPAGAGADARARRGDRADRPAAARLRPRRARRGARPDGRPGLRLPRDPDALRPLPDLRQDRRRDAPDRGAAAVLAARGDGRLPRREAAIARRACSPSTPPYKSRRFCSSTPTLFNAGTPHSQLSSCYLYVVDDTLESIMRPRHRRERDVLQVGGRARRLVDGGARHRLAHRGHQRLVAGRRAVPEAAQRPARRRQPGRPARGLRLRVPGGLAQRHPRVPRAAPQHRRRAPPHARHEHRVLGPGPVHEARRGARARGRCSAPPTSRTCTTCTGARSRSATPSTRRRAAAGEMFGEPIAGARAVEADAQDAVRDRASVDHVQGRRATSAARRTTRASSTRATSAPRSRSTRAPRRPRSATSARSCSTGTCRPTARSTTRRCATTVRVAVRALDDVIDVNFYPTEAARTANMRHRPVGLGVMGLQYALYARGLAFDSEEAAEFGDEVMEAIAYYAYEASQRPRGRARRVPVVRGLEVGPRAAPAGHGRPARGGARRAGRRAARRPAGLGAAARADRRARACATRT